ncbi:hypothetical protein [Facilibium subflavum]|uniref:hypothetical protein n=1 Tax=Facilibium subflavum TaxID=2219058 RepID=UPI000E65D950|nr:hypothetical protein [Facilibium subflavum]
MALSREAQTWHEQAREYYQRVDEFVLQYITDRGEPMPEHAQDSINRLRVAVAVLCEGPNSDLDPEFQQSRVDMLVSMPSDETGRNETLLSFLVTSDRQGEIEDGQSITAFFQIYDDFRKIRQQTDTELATNMLQWYATTLAYPRLSAHFGVEKPTQYNINQAAQALATAWIREHHSALEEEVNFDDKSAEEIALFTQAIKVLHNVNPELVNDDNIQALLALEVPEDIPNYLAYANTLSNIPPAAAEQFLIQYGLQQAAQSNNPDYILEYANTLVDNGNDNNFANAANKLLITYGLQQAKAATSDQNKIAIADKLLVQLGNAQDDNALREVLCNAERAMSHHTSFFRSRSAFFGDGPRAYQAAKPFFDRAAQNLRINGEQQDAVIKEKPQGAGGQISIAFEDQEQETLFLSYAEQVSQLHDLEVNQQ